MLLPDLLASLPRGLDAADQARIGAAYAAARTPSTRKVYLNAWVQ